MIGIREAIFLDEFFVIAALLALLATPVFAINPIPSNYYLKNSSPGTGMSLENSSPSGLMATVTVAAGASEVCKISDWKATSAYSERKLIPMQDIGVRLFADSNTAGGGSATLKNVSISEWNSTHEVQVIAMNLTPACNLYGQSVGYSCNFSLASGSAKYISQGNYIRLKTELCARKVTANIRFNSSNRASNFTIVEETAVPIMAFNWTFRKEDSSTADGPGYFYLNANSTYSLNLTAIELGGASDPVMRIYIKYKNSTNSAWINLSNGGDANFLVHQLTPTNPSANFSLGLGSSTSIHFNITPKRSGKWQFNATPDNDQAAITSGQIQNFSSGKRLNFHYSSTPVNGINEIMNATGLTGIERYLSNTGTGTYFHAWIQHPVQNESPYYAFNISSVVFSFYENSTNPADVSYTPKLYFANSSMQELIGECQGLLSISSGLPMRQICQFGVDPKYAIFNSQLGRLNATIQVNVSTAGTKYAIHFDSTYESFAFLEGDLMSLSPNSAPNITEVTSIPSSFSINSRLNCSAAPYDNESGTITVEFSWYVNASQITEYDSNVSCSNGTICYTSVVVPPSALSIGANWTCTARAFDGLLYSAQVNSTQKTVGGNAPSIKSVLVDDGYLPTYTIDLLAGMAARVYCNGTVEDLDGYADITEVNSTFFHESLSYSSDADNFTWHYSNSSCSLSPQGDNTSHYSCQHAVQYMAKNGTWVCNVTAYDTYLSNFSYINANVSELLAINVTPTIEFGELAVGQTSDEVSSIVTNIGNVEIDLNLLGYGASIGDNLSMVCTLGTIPIGNERYNFTSGIPYSDMHQLTSSILGVTHAVGLVPQTGSLLSDMPIYWRLLVPQGVKGQCTGTIVASAMASID